VAEAKGITIKAYGGLRAHCLSPFCFAKGYAEQGIGADIRYGSVVNHPPWKI
jgi:hypothetical protein